MSQCDDNVLQPLKSAWNMRLQLVPQGSSKGPTGLCEQGFCRHSSLVPIYKIAQFKQTAAVQALKMISGGKHGAHLEPARPAVSLMRNAVERTD